MRYYLIDADKNELIVDLSSTKIHNADLVEYKFSTLKENKEIHASTVFVRKLAGMYYSSFDGISWAKLARQEIPTKMLNVNKVYDLYRGFKPSGLAGTGAGEMVTQMPGKIVKIQTKIGDKVSKGQTLVILEAMKMENEIKCGIDGVVKAIHVNVGQALEQGVLMLEVGKP